MPNSDIKFPLRIPVEVDRWLRSKAERDGLSLNAVICGILQEAVDGGVQGKGRREARAKKEAVSGVSEVVTEDGQRHGRKGAGGEADKCEIHGLVMKDFGTKWVCEGPPQHSVEKRVSQ